MSKTKNHKRVVITGIGPITSIGTGKNELWDSLINSKVNISRIPDRFEENYKFNSKFYVPYPKFSLEDYGYPLKYNSIMEEPAKLSLIGTKLALDDAGLKQADSDAISIIGVGTCGLRTGFHGFAAHNLFDHKELLAERGINSTYPRFCIPMSMPNSVSAWVSIINKINGFNFTINAACASGTYAIGEAYRYIKNGYANLAITGGVESLLDETGATMRGFDNIGTLTRSEDGFPRPFSKDRSGFLFSEGAGCILILEELESAIRRGAEIYAEVLDYVSGSDAHNIVQIERSGLQIIKMLKKIIKEKKIDYLNAHGTGTILSDSVEYNVIKEVFGRKENQPLINSTKGILGHSIGASGALEVAASALSIKNSKVHANITQNAFSDMNLVENTTNIEIDHALSASYGFGGHNAVILLAKYR